MKEPSPCVPILDTECQSPITPIIFVESKWRLSMHIYMSPQTILPNMNEIYQEVSKELRQQDSDDGQKVKVP